MPGLGAAVRLARDETECANAEDAGDVRSVGNDDPADAPEVLPGGAAEENDTRTVRMAGGKGADKGPHEPAENDGADDQRGKGKTEPILPGRDDGECENKKPAKAEPKRHAHEAKSEGPTGRVFRRRRGQ